MAIKTHLYYWSNDDIPFDTIEMTTEITENRYPIVVEEPPAELKQPKYDWSKSQWVENDAVSQGQRITEVEGRVKELDKTADKLQETAKTLSTTQQASTQQTGLVMKQMQSNQEMMLKMQQMLAVIAKNTTNATENGGNK